MWNFLIKVTGYNYRWHLGNCKDDYLPHKRGFDTFFGYWEGAVVSLLSLLFKYKNNVSDTLYLLKDYYDKTFAYNGGNLRDFHLNAEPFEDEGEYSMVSKTKIRILCIYISF